MKRIIVSALLFCLVALSVITVRGIEKTIEAKIVGQWVFMYHGQKRDFEFKSDKTFEGSYPVTGKHFSGAWKDENSTVMLVRDGETASFGIVTLKSDNEAEYMAEGYPMTGRRAELPPSTTNTTNRALAAPPGDKGGSMNEDTGPNAPGELDDERMVGRIGLDANVKETFPKLELLTDEKGNPIRQTIQLNEKVIVKDGWRYSGFWFVVDRSEAAQKQGFHEWKGKMALYLYFLPPKAMEYWGMKKVNGELSGSWSYRPLKLWRFKQALRGLPPEDKDRLIFQTMGAKRLKEGSEYYMEFGFPINDTASTDMTICLGFRKTIWNYKQWPGFNEAVDFLGLEHKGQVGPSDRLQQKK